jgi:hypothetical protein
MSYIIVLGNSKQAVMDKRVDTAVSEFRNKYAMEVAGKDNNVIAPISNLQNSLNAFIILTGTKRETSYMFNYATKFLDAQYIIQENMSKNTIDNLVNCKNIIDSQNNASFGFVPNVTICTSTFHIKRTILISKFIYTGNYNMHYIHTSEQVTPEEYARESQLADSILNYFVSKMV